MAYFYCNYFKRGVKKGFLHYNFQVYTERTINMRQVEKKMKTTHCGVGGGGFGWGEKELVEKDDL